MFVSLVRTRRRSPGNRFWGRPNEPATWARWAHIALRLSSVTEGWGLSSGPTTRDYGDTWLSRLFDPSGPTPAVAVVLSVRRHGRTIPPRPPGEHLFRGRSAQRTPVSGDGIHRWSDPLWPDPFGGSPGSRLAADLIAQVADGLAAAHAVGLIHRDIKPDNIMIDPATSRAKLMDFGLARDETSGENLTRDDIIAGTPTHMSPEQARGTEPLDGRSDIYSLGVTLYEALTGEVPFHGTPQMVLQQVCDDEPRPPRRLNDQIHRDLETICLKAMAKEPARRYATALDLADDLRRWQKGEPIRARPLGPIGRLGRWCRRNTRVAALIASVFSLLVLVTVISWVAVVRISREQARTLREHQAARDHYDLALETLSSLVFNVNQKLGTRPGTLKLKREILQTAQTGLERIAQSSEADGVTNRGAVVAYAQLGDLLFALGHTPDAQRAYEKSRDLAKNLVEASPGSIQPLRDLALAFDNVGNLLRYNNENEGTEANYRKAIAIREQLIRDNARDPEILRDLSVSINNIGLIHLRRAEYAAAMAQFQRCSHSSKNTHTIIRRAPRSWRIMNTRTASSPPPV